MSKETGEMQGRRPANFPGRRGAHVLAAALVLLLGLFAGHAAAAMPLKGTIIAARATATYYNGGKRVSETAFSNTVLVEIAVLEAVKLENDRSLLGGRGTTVVGLSHVVTNTGNVVTTYRLTYANLTGGDDFDLIDLRLARDHNGNGIFDAGDIDLGPSGAASLTLVPGAFAQVLVLGAVPGSAVKGQRGLVQLTATSTGDAGVTAVNTDTVTASDVNVVQLQKAASLRIANRGDRITYTLSGINAGEGEALPLAVQLDGVTERRIVVRDRIPANTAFAAVIDTGTGIVAYHLAGQPKHTYRRQLPADPATVDAVAFLFEHLPSRAGVKAAFAVTVNATAEGTIRNQAEVCLAPEEGGGEVSQFSSEVLTEISGPALPPAIAFYRDDRYNQTTASGLRGEPLYIGLGAAVCNSDSSTAETVRLQLGTSRAGDRESGLEAVETGPNTGIFRLRVPTARWPENAAMIRDDRIIEAAVDDTVTVNGSCGGQMFSAALPMEPQSVVFDTVTNRPVPGAVVKLAGADGEQSVTTGADGVFQFPPMNAGGYTLTVIPPQGYLAPSTRPIPSLPPARRLDERASYGQTFTHPAWGFIAYDIPVDQPPAGIAGALVIGKEASRDIVTIGETVRYTVTITNASGVDVRNGRVEDVLPLGFSYIKGTARFDGAAIADPVGAPGRNLTFKLGHLEKDGRLKLTYRVRGGVGAQRGDGWNRAQYLVDGGASNIARAQVVVNQGVFADEGFILGKVFLDCNDNGVQDQGEAGIPGIRLYLETGDFVIADEEGKYSFYGIAPRTHVLKADTTTLPEGAGLRVIDNRNALDAGSRFVDLKKGELHRADFAVNTCTDQVRQEVEKRRTAQAQTPAELVGTGKSLLTANPLQTAQTATFANTAGRPAAGIVDRAGTIDTLDKLSPLPPVSSRGAGSTRKVVQGDDGPVRAATTVNFEPLMAQMAEGFGFLDLKDGDTLASDQVSVRLKGPAGATFALLVNGREVPVERVGQKTVMASRSLQAWEYVAVQLQTGENVLIARVVDPFGNVRDTKEIKIRAPGRLARLELSGPKEGAPADGQTPAPIKVRLVDEHGTPVSARTPVTLETTQGRWTASDLDPREPGVQTFIEGGAAVYELTPPLEAGKALIRVSCGIIKQEANIDFLPHLRPLIAAGVIEGALGLSRLDPGKVEGVSSAAAFEQEISSFMTGGDSRAGARGALFLKGRVRGDYLLTLAYDSDKDAREQLFRDIRPDQFYPVYGDSSVRGFEAQSSGSLYVRVDKGRSFVLYGDYTTMQPQARTVPLDDMLLGAYSRSLNGGNVHYENDRVSVSGFGAYTDSTQRVVEIRAQGISGPYLLDLKGYVLNSEKVELVTRDRSQPSLVVDSRTVTRFADYWIDAVAGWLTFTRPVASTDENLNPVYIRITYEIESGDKAWVYGGSGDVRITDWLSVGGTFARDEHQLPATGQSVRQSGGQQGPQLGRGSAYELMSGHSTVTLGKNDWLVGEVAQSREVTGRTGMAERLEFLHKDEQWEARVYSVHSDANFYNPNGSVLSGRNELGAAAAWRLDQKTRLFVEGVHSAALDDDALKTENAFNGISRDRTSVMLGVDRQLRDDLRLQTGGRYTMEQLDEREGGGTQETESLLARLGWRPRFLPKADGYLEYEQAVNDPNRRLAAIGANYQLWNQGRLYARHEFISTLNTEVQGFNDKGNGTTLNPALGLTGAPTSRQTTAVGIEYNYLENSSAFSEYRIRDAFSGNESEAAMGVRNRWDLGHGLKANTSLERIQPFTGTEGDSTLATAVTGALTWSDDTSSMATARLEWRGSETTDSWLSTLGYARKLTPNWTGLVSNTFWHHTETRSGNVTLKDRVRVGAAYRQTATNAWNLLMLYEYKPEIEEAADENRQAHIWSVNANWQPVARLNLSGRYAGEVVLEDTEEYRGRYTAHLVSGRLTYDLTDRLDLGLGAGTLFDGHDAASRQHMFGLEGGYLLSQNLWLSVGYNLIGFKSDDLAGDNYTDQGPYVRLRFKFDEGLFGWLR